MRARITRELIERKGFTIIAAEADWPDAARIDHYIRYLEHPAPDWIAFTRFPTWMWRNQEVRELVDWLRDHNRRLPAERRVGFYGLDLYSLFTSISAVLTYLEDVDPKTAAVARHRYGCLTPWESDPATYGYAALTERYRSCESDVVRMLQELLAGRLHYLGADGERYFDAVQNARLVEQAERYYRLMYYGGPVSWNHRDTHMFETLKRVLEARGAGSKAVVWAHNSHVGDAAATEMGARGELEHRPALSPGVWHRSLLHWLRHRPWHRGGGERLGRGDGDQGGPPVDHAQLRTALPLNAHTAIPARTAR